MPSLQVRWLGAAVAMAGVLIVVAVGLQWRRGSPPRLDAPNREEREILRSGTISVVSPVGDLKELPTRIQWQPAADAARYDVRLLEVDRSELWTTSTTAAEADIPPAIQSKIVPAKTLLIQVSAFDRADRKLAESESVRFRVLQKVYSH
jgi:hypothetical protein